jgi:FkbM family methyltransferase
MKYTSNGVTIDLSYEEIPPSVGRQIEADSYEEAEAELLKEHLVSSIPVIELGTGIGYTSSLINQRLDPSIQHITVEANSNLLATIEYVKSLNQATFTIINQAYSTEDEEITLNIDHSFPWSSIESVPNQTDTITVKTITLQEIKNRFNLDICTLVVDSEGGEFDLLSNELDVLSSNCHSLFIEFDRNKDGDVEKKIQNLKNVGFVLVDEHEGVCLFQNSSL